MNAIGLLVLGLFAPADPSVLSKLEPPPLQSAKPFVSEVPRAPIPPGLFDRVPSPVIPLVSLFSANDYPDEAVRNVEEGIVGVVLRVSHTGQLTDCIVESSSHSASLDSQTCRIIWQRARFKPARDERGRAVESAIRQRIRWALPGAPPSTLPWSLRFTLTFAKAGTRPACRISTTGALDPDHEIEQDTGNCDFVVDNLMAEAAELAIAKGTVIFETRFSPSTAALKPGTPPGMVILSQRTSHVDIDPSGEVIDCRVGSEIQLGETVSDCPELLGSKYARPIDRTGQPISIKATVVKTTIIGM